MIKQFKLFGIQMWIALIIILILFIAIIVVAVKLLIYFFPVIIILIVLYYLYKHLFKEKVVKKYKPKPHKNYHTGKVIDVKFKEKN